MWISRIWPVGSSRCWRRPGNIGQGLFLKRPDGTYIYIMWSPDTGAHMLYGDIGGYPPVARSTCPRAAATPSKMDGSTGATKAAAPSPTAPPPSPRKSSNPKVPNQDDASRSPASALTPKPTPAPPNSGAAPPPHPTAPSPCTTPKQARSSTTAPLAPRERLVLCGQLTRIPEHLGIHSCPVRRT